ncbi:glutamate--tRNA ligase [bacterium]|nr:glutamate--tRNA ligase [bacterium]
MIRVRFAPSPTGNLHIGTLRAALFNWVYAKTNKGTFVLRIEDTDRERSKSEFETNIYDGMNWLGFVPDEGPNEGGNYGPYRQAERIDAGIYKAAAQQLLDKGLAYYCFLTPEEIEQEKASAIKKGIPYMHSRQSSEMTSEAIKSALEEGKPYAVRFKMTDERVITFSDQVRGHIDFDCSLLSDFVLMKSDGTPSYNFAVVVDDAAMQITHVIRGEDHISNMPRQLALYEAFGYKIPEFAHLPMILGPDKSKLSKRHGATAVTQYRDRGFLKEAFFNYLALLGWSPKDETELLSSAEIVNQFGLERVHKSGAVFDIQKLLWMNGQYLRQLSVSQLCEAMKSFFSDIFKEAFEALDDDKQQLLVGAIQDNLDVLADANDYCDVFLETDSEFETALASCEFNHDQQNVLRACVDALNEPTVDDSSQGYTALLESLCTSLNLGKGKVFKPVRLAVTARGSGPLITDVLAFFGKERLLERLKRTVG